MTDPSAPRGPSLKTPRRPPPRAIVRVVGALRNALLRAADALVPAEVAMLDRLTGYYVFQVASAAVALGIPAALSAEATSVEQIAATIGAPPERTSRLLRALASHGIGEALPHGRYKANRLSKVLDERTDGSLAALLRFVGAAYYQRAWEQFASGLRDNVNPFVAAHGRPLFEYLGSEAEAARNFSDAMDAMTMLDAPGIAAAFDFSSLPAGSKICDVGGGHGPLLATILSQHPALRGVLFDGQPVLRDASALLARYGVADRVDLVAGSFFDHVPSGCDVYLLKDVLHDWDDDTAVAILSKVRAAANGARVLVAEILVDGAEPRAFGPLFDLMMMTTTHDGRQRSEREWRALFERAGLRLTRVARTVSPISVIEGIAR